METDTKSNAGITAESTSKPCCHRATAVVRILMGLAFTVFGLNGFFNFLPQPKTMPEATMAFFGALMNTHYMLPLIFGTQLLVGILLLLNRFVPLALAFIAPVIVNIIAFHIFIDPPGIGPGIVVLILELYLAWAYRGAFCSMLRARTTPGGACNVPPA